ncbi:MAG: type II toxin-antitoxin system HicB family antitoxin [Acidobacteriota bacterium]|jgi:predicted RNase H-like HicB family nuclease|nr:type II toxin-antitoxin system HicB family antitoxin [Acidobacteriota bacterium]
MRKLTYYAVFEPAEGGYGVYWPDLPGCASFGKTFEQAEAMATEALGLHICSMEQDGDALPEATAPPFEEMPEGGIVVPTTIFPDIVKNTLDNRSVRTNITLPAWLKDWAGAQGINLSQALQTTLRQMHDVK